MSQDWLNDTDRREVRRTAIFGMSWTVVIVLFVLALIMLAGVLRFGFNVGTAEIKGKGEAHIQKESAGNRIFAQQRFEDAYNAVQKDVANIKAAQAAADVSPTAVNLTNVTGVTQICNADVAEYNADAKKYLLEEFRRAELPSHISLAVCEGKE